jgi:quinol monooxygenase YgiN
MSMITLISQWSVRADISDDEWNALLKNLQTLAGTVEAAEPDTLVYRVHTAAADPRNGDSPDTAEARQYVTFYEVYRSAESFQVHLNGQPFNDFLRDNIQYFEENPDRKNYPLTKTTFLQKQSGYFREGVDHH